MLRKILVEEPGLVVEDGRPPPGAGVPPVEPTTLVLDVVADPLMVVVACWPMVVVVWAFEVVVAPGVEVLVVLLVLVALVVLVDVVEEVVVGGAITSNGQTWVAIS